MTRRRLSPAYHIERSIATQLGLAEYPCACQRCMGGRLRLIATIARHHKAYGRDPLLPHPVLTVNGRSLRGPARNPDLPSDTVDSDNGRRRRRRGLGAIEVRDMLYGAYGMAGRLHRESTQEVQKPELEDPLHGPEEGGDAVRGRGDGTTAVVFGLWSSPLHPRIQQHSLRGHKVLPLIPKLQRLYKCPRIATLLGHHGDTEFDGVHMT
ncbi:hypothetical protein KC19_VG227100 [Ceratodon purpureus]|uniref:Uncharacterized protein n=1 Tax=Ceratodon purpureus TaxID=3225 RepID=A0A8T0HTD8_CERPU|nr:hypothetical protein KC19_VG227100 [Ceratodon purpureus]